MKTLQLETKPLAKQLSVLPSESKQMLAAFTSNVFDKLLQAKKIKSMLVKMDRESPQVQ